MNYDRYFIMSCLLGDEYYKDDAVDKDTLDRTMLEKRFLQLAGQPIGAYLTSGLPTFMLDKKTFIKARR